MLTYLRTKILSRLAASLTLLILAGCGQGSDQTENGSNQIREAMLASTSPSVSWVYYNGTYVWDYTAYEQAHPDNWNSGLSSNYASSAIKCLTGSKCIQQTPTAANGIWRCPSFS